MSIDLVAELADLFAHEITGAPGTTNGFGKWIPSGTPVTLPAYVTGKRRMVRDIRGQEVVSSVHAIVAGMPGFSPEGWRYSIPTHFVPNQDLKALAVENFRDEENNGFEVVYFP